MSFVNSTHNKRWIFTSEKLRDMYTKRNEDGKRLLSGVMEEVATVGMKRPRSVESRGEESAKRSRIDGGSSGEEGCASLPSSSLYLSVDEEQSLIDWCSLALLRMCLVRHFDREVTSTALVYFRRFYVRGLFLQYPPYEMMCVVFFTPTASPRPWVTPSPVFPHFTKKLSHAALRPFL